ncbi:MAG: hypothetical protein LBQ38_00830 [Spirochaetaceae bacterium]|jgi:hypothetical protein|nr:hypothetical protein [Spirochaetaceae bacterium]
MCFILVSLFAAVFVIAQEDHDCRGEGCPVCMQIQWARDFRGQFRYAPPRPGFSANLVLFAALVLKRIVFDLLPITAVTLKVKITA